MLRAEDLNKVLKKAAAQPKTTKPLVVKELPEKDFETRYAESNPPPPQVAPVEPEIIYPVPFEFDAGPSDEDDSDEEVKEKVTKVTTTIQSAKPQGSEITPLAPTLDKKPFVKDPILDEKPIRFPLLSEDEEEIEINPDSPETIAANKKIKKINKQKREKRMFLMHEEEIYDNRIFWAKRDLWMHENPGKVPPATKVPPRLEIVSDDENFVKPPARWGKYDTTNEDIERRNAERKRRREANKQLLKEYHSPALEIQRKKIQEKFEKQKKEEEEKLAAERLALLKPAPPPQKPTKDVVHTGFAEGTYSRMRRINGLFWMSTFEESKERDAQLKDPLLKNFTEEGKLECDYLSDSDKPQLILVFLPEYLEHTAPVGHTNKAEVHMLNIGVVDYKVSFQLHARSIYISNSPQYKNILLEQTSAIRETYNIFGAVRALLSKIDNPKVPGAIEAYAEYLDRRRQKRLDEMKVASQRGAFYCYKNIDGLPETQVTYLKKSFSEDYSAALAREKLKPLQQTGLEVVLELLLAIRGTGPKEVCFIPHYLSKAKYRTLLPFTPEDRNKALQYLSIPSIIRREPNKQIEKAKETVRVEIQKVIEFVKVKVKVGDWKTKIKLLTRRAWHRSFEMAIQLLWRVFIEIKKRDSLRAAAEPRQMIEPKDPEVPLLTASSAKSEKVLIEEMQRISFELDNLNSLDPNKIRAIVGEETKLLVQDFTNLVDGFQNVQKGVSTCVEDVESLKKKIDDVTLISLKGRTEFNDEIKSIKASISEQSTLLAELRQSHFELKHAPLSDFEELKTVTLPGLEAKVSSFLLELSKLSDDSKIDTEKRKQEMETIETVRKEFMTAAKENSNFIKTAKETLDSQRRLVTDEIKKMPGEFISKADALEARCRALQFDYDTLQVNKFQREMDQTRFDSKRFTEAIPDLEARMQNLGLFVAQQETALEEARRLTFEMRSYTKDSFKQVAAAQRIEENKFIAEVDKHRRKGKTSSRAKVAAAKANKSGSINLTEESAKVKTKIASTVREWGCLQKGDFVLYRGEALEVDDEFNPSLRIKHNNQSGNKWEAQKHANLNWYCRGIHTWEK